ncbi:MAG: hypothetical protein ACYDAY_07580 [Candidatus Dormibacteria bacterium]
MHAIHQVLANATVLFFVILAGWGVVLFMTGRSLGGAWRGAQVIGLVVLLVTGAAGLLTLLTQGAPHNLLHVMYGVAAPIILGGAMLSGDRISPRTERLVTVLGTVLVVFLLYRGFATA